MPVVTYRRAPDGLAVTLLLACCLFWGFQQVLVKATLTEMAPIFQASVRFILATVLLLLWCLVRRIALWPASTPWRAGVLAGLLFASEFACLYLGMNYTSASRLTLFLYTSPFWVALLLPHFVAGEQLRRAQWLGLVLAFAGVALALMDGLWGATHTAQPLGWLGDLLGLLAGLLWALTTVTIRATGLGAEPPERQLLYQLVVSALTLPLLSLALGEVWNWEWSTLGWVSIGLQGSIGAFLSYLAWMWMLTRYTATKLSSFVFLTPVFALCFGAWWLGEPLTLPLVGALALVASGLVLVNRR